MLRILRAVCACPLALRYAAYRMDRSHSKKHKRARRKGRPTAMQGAVVARAATAFMPEGEKKIVIFTDDMLINQLRRDGPRIEESFDRLCANDLAELSALLSKTNGLIYSGLSVAMQREDQLRIACAKLLLNGANSFASATAVLRMGYVLQPGIIIRALLEAVSTALHLMQHPKDLAAYENHTLQSPKTIAAAKRALPPFGPLYGHFSDNFAHIGQLHKSITPIREYTERHDALNVNLSSLRIAAWLLYVSAELAFNEIVVAPRYWHSVEQGYKYDPTEQEKEWMKCFFQMAKVA